MHRLEVRQHVVEEPRLELPYAVEGVVLIAQWNYLFALRHQFHQIVHTILEMLVAPHVMHHPLDQPQVLYLVVQQISEQPFLKTARIGVEH